MDTNRTDDQLGKQRGLFRVTWWFGLRGRREGAPARWGGYWSLFFLFALLLLTACGSGGTQSTPTPFPTPVVPEKPTYTVERGTVVKTLEFRGRVSPVTEQELFFETDGYVRRVHVAQNDLVEGGDVLAELEISDLENQLAQTEVALQTAELRLRQAAQENTDALVEARINLQNAELRLSQAEQENASALAEARIALEKAQLSLSQTRNQDVLADVTVAQVNLAQAVPAVTDAEQEYRESLERHQQWGEWGEPQERVDAYARALDQARDNLTIAQARHDQAVANQNGHSYTTQLQAKEVDLARLRVEKLERGVDPLLAQELELAKLRAEKLERGVDPLLAQEVEKARLDVQRLQGRIEDARLVAPFDGRVLSLNVREGNLATAFKSVLVLGDPGALEVTADLGADALSQMSVGQAATIRLLNRPERDWSGQVRQLPYPYGGGAGSETENRTTARIALDDPQVALEIGELGTVVIFLEQKDDVLWLPPVAIRSFQGREFVVIQDGDVQRRVDVRLGLESEEQVEIMEGVEAGQVVIGP
jgi:multidrug efflux pump subunit AcrA (membrane-fusion protein)